MIEKKDVKNLTNAEIKLYMIEMENEYEIIKQKITDLCGELDDIDKEYANATTEIKARQTI